jgi:RNA polymerase sigma factor (sigma-70 family)
MTADFANLLALHLPRVHRAARGLVSDEQEAHEIAQDALARAWAARDRYDAHRPFYPWLYTIVRNACRDAAARRKHRAFPGLEVERVQGKEPSPLSELSSKEARQRVQRAMARLPEPMREVLVMRHFEDLAYAEMAELLDVPVGTVMSRLYRARKALLDIVRKEEA